MSEKEAMLKLMEKQHNKCAECGGSLEELGIYPLKDRLLCAPCGENVAVSEFEKHKKDLKLAHPYLTEEQIEKKVKETIAKSNEKIPPTEQTKEETLPYANVYEWASYLTLEQSWIDVKNYLWTPQTKRLLRRLKHNKYQLIAVVGLQGIGKTVLRAALESKLEYKNVFSVKWGGFKSFMDLFHDRINEMDTLARIIFALYELRDKMGYLPFLKWAEKKWGNEAAWHFKKLLKEGETTKDLYPQNLPEKAVLLRILNKKLGKRYDESDFLGYVSDVKAILLDLPDYTKHTATYMNRDLSSIQTFWERLMDEQEGRFPNLVLFIQKELFHGHFFFGKCDVVELRPLTPEELTEYYARLFGNYEPFTEEALTEIAFLSRGIFRRFKKYILICLDNWYDLLDSNKITQHNKNKNKNLINKKKIQEWISLKQLVKDMELELYDIFPKSKMLLRNAVIMLRFLREHGPTPQLELTNKLFDGYKMGCSRMLNKLEAHGYIKNEKQGKEKIWSLA